MNWELDGRPLERVLVTRLRYLGDIVMSLVVPTALKLGDPSLEIDFLCERAGAPLLAGHADLDRLHVLAVHRSGRDADARRGVESASESEGRGTVATFLALRRRRYDLAVDLFFNPRSAWLIRAGGARFRIGGDRGSRRRLYTHAVSTPTPDRAPRFRALAPGGLGEHLGRLAPLVHAPTGLGFLDWFVAHCPRGLAPRLAPRPTGPRLREALERLGVSDGRLGTVLVPGATWPSKAWLPERWGRLAAELERSGRGPVVAVAPPGRDLEATARLESAGLDRGGWLPPLSLDEILALLTATERVVTVDGGLMHAAIALGRPTVALFGPTDPGIWFPYESFGPYRVLCDRPDCHPCDLHVCGEHVCLPALETAHVLSSLDDIDARGEGGP